MNFRFIAILLGAVVPLSAGSLGCSTFGEKHYFASLDSKGNVVNFYRLKVDGGTLLSSSRYVSGYFDENAVNQYFGTISQPANAMFTGGQGNQDTPTTMPAVPQKAATGTASTSGGSPPATAPAQASGAIVSLGESPASHGTLILRLSSNSDAIAESIGGLAQSNDTLSAVTLLANRDKLQVANNAQATLTQQQAIGAALQSFGQQFFVFDPNNKPTAAACRNNSLTYLNEIAAEFGNDEPFTTIAQAKSWLDRKRGALLQP